MGSHVIIVDLSSSIVASVDLINYITILEKGRSVEKLCSLLFVVFVF